MWEGGYLDCEFGTNGYGATVEGVRLVGTLAIALMASLSLEGMQSITLAKIPIIQAPW